MMMMMMMILKKLCFQNVLRTTRKQKRGISHPPGLKSVIERRHFHDGLVQTVGLTLERKLRFKISPVQYEQGGPYHISRNITHCSLKNVVEHIKTRKWHLLPRMIFQYVMSTQVAKARGKRGRRALHGLFLPSPPITKCCNQDFKTIR